MNKKIGLYIHIPFCRKKCCYCDFVSYSGMENYIAEYVTALKKEIRLTAPEIKNYKIESVFFGGGTPSYLDSKYIIDILQVCNKNLIIDDKAEITLESNPGTITCLKLTDYRSSGINRLSMGLQAWQNSLLKKLGRIHTAGQFVKNYEHAKKAGFKNINIDLMFGLPGQKLYEWDETLEKVIDFKPKHISCYSLNIEKNTPLGLKVEKGLVRPASEELDRKMYHQAKKRLEENNYRHYEISNFAKPGFECTQNRIYWDAREYMGIGAGAHSYINGLRFCNEENITEYLRLINNSKKAIKEKHNIDTEEDMKEYAMLGFRYVDGISLECFNKRYHKNFLEVFEKQIEKLLKSKLIEFENGKVKLTRKGLDIANQVFIEFV